jgi:hypothetical protein
VGLAELDPPYGPINYSGRTQLTLRQ